MTCVGKSYDFIFFIVGLHDQLVQIPIDTPGLAKVFIPLDLILTSKSQFSPPSFVPLPSLTEVTANAFLTKKIPALILDSMRNPMTAYKKNLVHGLDIANPFPPDLEVTCIDLAIIREVGLKLVW